MLKGEAGVEGRKKMECWKILIKNYWQEKRNVHCLTFQLNTVILQRVLKQTSSKKKI